MRPETVTLGEAARLLRVDIERALDLVFSGELGGGPDEMGRIRVPVRAVDDYLATTARTGS